MQQADNGSLVRLVITTMYMLGKKVTHSAFAEFIRNKREF